LHCSASPAAACQRADTNANTNLTANANTSPTNANANAKRFTGSDADNRRTRAGKISRGFIVFSAETEGGQKTIGIPSLSAEVARNGADRRVSFKLPDGSDLIYLEQGEQTLL